MDGKTCVGDPGLIRPLYTTQISMSEDEWKENIGIKLKPVYYCTKSQPKNELREFDICNISFGILWFQFPRAQCCWKNGRARADTSGHLGGANARGVPVLFTCTYTTKMYVLSGVNGR